MALSEKNAFSFTWEIVNFSMCPYFGRKYMFSPTFVLYGTKWNLSMSEEEENNEKYISCYLGRIKSCDEEEAVTVGFELIAHSVTAKKEVRVEVGKCIFDNTFGSGFPNFCLRKDIINSMNGFLPNDTFTVECRIWRIIDGAEGDLIPPPPLSKVLKVPFSDSSLREEILNTAARDEILDFQTQFASSHYLARTRLPVTRKCIIWPIRKFSSLRPGQRLTIPIVTVDAHAPSLAMTIYLSRVSLDDQSVQIEIRKEDCYIEKGCFVRCRITAVNGSMKAQHAADDEHFFEPTKKEDVWKFPTFLQMNTLKEKYLTPSQGTLNLRCEFAFTREGAELHIEGNEWVSFLSQFPKCDEGVFDVDQSISKQMYKEGKFSDVTLRSGARSFKAHKNILSIRSPVFMAMFENNMREKESEVVDITDYDPDTVERLLTFIYTNSVEDLQQEKAMKLYSVADKYEVLSLKWRCSNLLKSALSISNVCEVLTLADLHQDGDLLDHVKNYIQLNTNVILNSQMWEDLIKSNAPLAARVMRDLLTGKMGHL